jgi:hypothetical protein
MEQNQGGEAVENKSPRPLYQNQRAQFAPVAGSRVPRHKRVDSPQVEQFLPHAASLRSQIPAEKTDLNVVRDLHYLRHHCQHSDGNSMNTGQTLLTIGALVLLGTAIITTNRTSFQHGGILQQTEVGLYAVSLAQGLIEEAAGKAFDTYTAPPADTSQDVKVATSTTYFSTTMGPESGEVYPNFDDFDDFNSATPRSVNVTGVGTFEIWAQVFYVTPTNADVNAGSKTWHKRMLVSVVGPSMLDTVKVPYIFSYWYFR